MSSPLYRAIQHDHRGYHMVAKGCPAASIRYKTLGTVMYNIDERVAITGLEISDDLCLQEIRKLLEELDSETGNSEDLDKQRNTLEKYLPVVTEVCIVTDVEDGWDCIVDVFDSEEHAREVMEQDYPERLEARVLHFHTRQIRNRI